MLDHHGGLSPLDDLRPVTDAATISRLIATVRSVHTSEALRRYVVDIGAATRHTSLVRLGASPRATLHVLRAARARAALAGRDHVLPDDVQVVAPTVLGHRLLLSSEAQLARRRPAEVVTEVVERTRVPSG